MLSRVQKHHPLVIETEMVRLVEGKLYHKNSMTEAPNRIKRFFKSSMHLKFVHCKCYKCREAACLSFSFSNIFTWQTYNALFIIRSLSKYFVEHLSEELILQQFEAKPREMGGGSGHTALYIIQVNSYTECIII